jgi:cytochrome c peroxidase
MTADAEPSLLSTLRRTPVVREDRAAPVARQTCGPVARRRPCSGWLAAVLALGIGSMTAASAAPTAAELTAQERERILSMGPWPPPPRKDPGNRASGNPVAIELGRQLFRDPRMSPIGYIACVTCHQPDRAFGDGKSRAHGLADLPRNTPALNNLAGQTWYGWGGASDSLWMASIRPIVDARELDGSADSVVRLFVREPALAACYRRVFGVSATRQPQRTLFNVGKALAAFVETLVTERTPFDDLRDALAQGAPLPDIGEGAWRGLRLFVGRGGCIACHAGPALTDGGFHATSSAADHGGSRIDSGRLRDAALLKASVFNLQGPGNDDRARRNARATRALRVDAQMAGHFRTPGLRNVAVTGPYLHDGRVDRLTDAVSHPRSGTAALQPGDAQDLAAFLATLTDRHGAVRPWQAAYAPGCD